MTWHVARSLNVLLGQLDVLAPNRNRDSDGAIGDAAHATRDSDHNPWYNNTVTARDFTHDPAGGLDCGWLATELVRWLDTRLKYVIWNGRIFEREIGVWLTYRGVNPHTKHLHLSVQPAESCESLIPWRLVPVRTHPEVEMYDENAAVRDQSILYRVHAVAHGFGTVQGGPDAGERLEQVEHWYEVQHNLRRLLGMEPAGKPGTPGALGTPDGVDFPLVEALKRMEKKMDMLLTALAVRDQ